MVSNKQKNDDDIFQESIQFHQSGDLNKAIKGCSLLKKSLGDFSDTASLIKMLDVVISVDSVIAHLAGALGKKTFLLLPEKSSFLWMNERKDTPWYPSVKIFRQSTLGDWKKPMEELICELQL